MLAKTKELRYGKNHTYDHESTVGFSCEMDNSQPSPKGRYARPTDAVQRLNVGGLETIRSRP